MKILDWHNCYSGSLKGKIVDDAFQHPAKMAWGLTMRIFQHLFDEGWLKEGDLVTDPFGGIATTGLAAASFGCPCIIVELEEKFCKLAEQNFELHREQWEKMGKPMPICIQGDSRQFSSIIREAIDSIITSPPYAGIMSTPTNSIRTWTEETKRKWWETYRKAGGGMSFKAFVEYQERQVFDYGTTIGQLGAMKEGDPEAVKAVITSPPYAESLRPETEEQTRRKQERIAKAKTIHNGRTLEKPSPGKAALGGGYGISEGQIGHLHEGSHEAVVDVVVTSPPYERSMDSSENAEARAERADGFAQGMKTLKYGENPYRFLSEDPSGLSNEERRRLAAQNPQIGQKQGDTYWEAVARVYSECFKALKPNGIMCVVVKDFVRNKKRMPLCSQTLELLQAIGFKPLERIRAWVVSEAEQKSLMPDVVPDYRKARKSFFRRLAERKGGPRIDWEEVLICQKPDDNPNHNSLAPQQKTRA